MNSRTTPEFWQGFAVLPSGAQRAAIGAYGMWREDCRHPSLHFKRVHSSEAIWSVRVGIHWRAIGRLDRDTVTWFWIGSHADYDRMIDSVFAIGMKMSYRIRGSNPAWHA